VFPLAADPSVKQRILDNARTGGAALWLVAPTRDRADHLVALLADYSYSSLRYYAEDGVADGIAFGNHTPTFILWLLCRQVQMRRPVSGMASRWC
jgi:hypothetical protein